MPRISIVTPNHNYGHFLEATILSVVNQNYPDLEYIVMDDGSTDDSVRVIQRHAHRLAHWETHPNQGQYKTITAGFARSTGEVMGWINSDDMHLPWTLRLVGEIFDQFPEVEWISTLQPGFWDWQGHPLEFASLSGFSKEAFLDGRYFSPFGARVVGIDPGVPCQGCVQQESTFWRRSLWERAGGYVSHEFGSAGDFELWTRFFQHAQLYGVAAPLAGFRLQNQQQTTQAEKYARLSFQALEKFRHREHWRPNRGRNSVFRFVLPWSERLARMWHYHGRRIVRKNIDSPSAHWEIEDHSFA